MTNLLFPAVLAVLHGATIDVAPGADLAEALSRARAGDVLRLGAGEHRGTLGRLSGVRIVGAGAGVTVVFAPEGADGAVSAGDVAIERLTLRAGEARCGLKVLAGSARLLDVALAGGACGAFVSGGRLEARELYLSGAYGILVERGEASLEGGSSRGGVAGAGVLAQGTLALRRFDVVGPSREGGISVAGGAARLEGVVVRAPGPSGISVSAGGRVEGFDVTIAGAVEEGGFLGDCVQAIGGSVRLEASTLVRCGGAALEASRAEVSLVGADLAGGSAGCIALVNGARADLAGGLCAGRGPGLVVASGSRARTRAWRWWTDPAMWVDCASGARVDVERGETARQPCAAAP